MTEEEATRWRARWQIFSDGVAKGLGQMVGWCLGLALFVWALSFLHLPKP